MITEAQANLLRLEGLDPAAVLVALYERARPFGLGSIQAGVAAKLGAQFTLDVAREVLEQSGRVDYLLGRLLKVEFHRGRDGAFVAVDVQLYDRAYGVGAGAAALEAERIRGRVGAS